MTAPSVDAYVGLGSNLADPQSQVLDAMRELAILPATRLMAQSSLYRSAAIGPVEQPDFINAVARLSTRLDPYALLAALQVIEQSHGRQREVRWGPRTLDLDLLLYGDRHIEDERLQVPHPEMRRRAFVLVPLAEVAVADALPLLGSMTDLLAAIDPAEVRRIAAPPVAGGVVP